MCAMWPVLDVIAFFFLVLIPQQWRPWIKLKIYWPHGSVSRLHGTWDLKEGTSHKVWLQVRTVAPMRDCWLKHAWAHLPTSVKHEGYYPHSPVSTILHLRGVKLCVFTYQHLLFIPCCLLPERIWECFLFIKISIWHGHWKNKTIHVN